MNLSLQPQASFTVVRQIPNWTDTDTNYVQAVIRDAYTDTIIATLQLTNKGSQRFSKNWQVPADPSGQGFFISIVTSVYTDSGYTTKNGNYGDDENTYLVQDRLSARGGGGGGVDAFTVRRIIKEEIEAAKPEPVKIPEQKAFPAMRWDDVLKAIDGVKEAIPPFPTIPESDHSPILGAIEALKAALPQEKPAPEPVDLSPILEALDSFKRETDMPDKVRGYLEELVNMFEEKVQKAVDEGIKKTNFVTTFITHPTPTPAPKEQEAPPGDITKLAS